MAGCDGAVVTAVVVVSASVVVVVVAYACVSIVTQPHKSSL